MRDQDRSADQEVARIAARQHGCITWEQLLRAGLSADGIRRRVEKGVLHRVYRGAYRVGHRAPSVEASFMAAVLACGEGAVLSGGAAAFLYGLIRRSPSPEVTATRERRIRGVVTHRVRYLDGRDVTRHRRIPVTTVPRTLIDLATRYDLDDFGEICHEAQVRYRVKAPAVYGALERRPNAPGAANIHEVFKHGRVTLSRLERAFLALLRDARLPSPETNRHFDGRYVDCRWPEYRLTVELDSYTYHHTRHAWEQDRRRARAARMRGDEFRSYTHEDVTRERAQVVAELSVIFRGA